MESLDENIYSSETVVGQAGLESGSDPEPLKDLKNGGAGLPLPATEKPLTMAAGAGKRY